MVYYLALILIIWAVFFTAARFLKYYRIVKEYKEKTVATVVSAKVHEPTHKREKRAVDVLLSYIIEDKEGMSEITVPSKYAAEFQAGRKLGICYNVSGNGAVHIASDTGATKNILIGHLLALVLELVAFVWIWVTML